MEHPPLKAYPAFSEALSPISQTSDDRIVARRGGYRVTFHIHDDVRVLYIGRIEHRAHVYRRQ